MDVCEYGQINEITPSVFYTFNSHCEPAKNCIHIIQLDLVTVSLWMFVSMVKATTLLPPFSTLSVLIVSLRKMPYIIGVGDYKTGRHSSE